ncbi:MAG TPA: TolC family protein [Bryobacteraceae bacterium]|nr:TolC family protein [Bryobacteraceae bacterium]
MRVDRTIALLLCSFSPVTAQNPVTLQHAVNQAVARYPSVRVSQEQIAAAAAGIALARTAYLPRADVLAQLNRATRNNVFGLLLPQSVLPAISGPPKPENDMTNVWGSAIGFLVSWEPFDFGLRKANVDVATAGRQRAEASAARTKFEVASLTADAYLTVLAAQQTLRAAQAQVERARSIENIVGALVKAELRPGADASRTRAEMAVSETQVIQAEQAIAIGRATLKQFTGADVLPDAGQLVNLPQELPPADISLAANPYALEQKSAMAEVQARRKALDRSYYPRFALQASSYARGTGANPDGSTGGPLAGIGPNIENWAVGMTVTFPIMELPSLRARKEIERHHELAEAGRYDQLLLDLNARLDKASAALSAARRIAAQIPVQLQAAHDTEQQATARYRAGLGTLIEVADAQRLLTQAEIDNSLAKLNVWRALLGVAAASGDMQPFLDRIK